MTSLRLLAVLRLRPAHLLSANSAWVCNAPEPTPKSVIRERLGENGLVSSLVIDEAGQRLLIRTARGAWADSRFQGMVRWSG